MAQTYFPFDSGQGANITEAQWQKMAQYWLNTGVIKGVLNELLVYADSTGMQVKVKSGDAWINGHFYESDAEEILAIGTADSTNPRIDRVIIRLDWTANTIQLAVLQGTPAVSPLAPALTQNSSRWEISLAQVRVNAGVTTITAANITVERNYAQNAKTQQEALIPMILQSSWINYQAGQEATFFKDQMGVVHLYGRIKNGSFSDSALVGTFPSGYIPFQDITINVPSGGKILIGTFDGTIRLYGLVSNSDLVLDNITFRAK